eukprot:1332287-Amorphochlora_amoeboformis.AAC.1
MPKKRVKSGKPCYMWSAIWTKTTCGNLKSYRTLTLILVRAPSGTLSTTPYTNPGHKLYIQP